jgi:hypothetical protein
VPDASRPFANFVDGTGKVGGANTHKRALISECIGNAGSLADDADMSVVAPLSASSREPQKPRRLPKPIRQALVLMVRGDEDGRVIDFIAAAKRCGVAPDVMRRWLDRGEARQFLRSERQVWRAAICAANELALADVRDRSENQMARVHAVRALEGMTESETRVGASAPASPGFTIVIAPHFQSQLDEATVIDASPRPAPRARAEPELVNDPTIFRPPR